MIKLFLDILIYNYTFSKSYFFLLNIFDKSLLYNIMIGLIIDLFITHTLFFTTLYLIIVWILKTKLKINFHNFYVFYLFNILNIISYYLIFSFLYNFNISSILNILLINSLFIIYCYIKDNKDIKLIG